MRNLIFYNGKSMDSTNRQKNGFTLMELMVVVVLVGIMAGFGLPSYRKAILRGYERDAIIMLRAIGAGLEIYKARNGVYPDGATMSNVGAINSVLGLNVLENNLTYSCVTEPYSGPGPGFKCKAVSVPAPQWEVHIETDPIKLFPHCAAGPACPSCTAAGC